MIAFGFALAITGFCFLVGATGAALYGPPDDGAPWLYLLGGLQLAVAFLLNTISGNIGSMGSLSSASRFIAGMALVAAAVAASVIAGLPEPLPGIALDWPLLFHLERGAALAGGVGLIGIVVWRGANGEWPVGFANLVEYAPKKAVEVTAELFAKQEDRVSLLEREHDRRLRALERKAP